MNKGQIYIPSRVVNRRRCGCLEAREVQREPRGIPGRKNDRVLLNINAPALYNLSPAYGGSARKWGSRPGAARSCPGAGSEQGCAAPERSAAPKTLLPPNSFCPKPPPLPSATAQRGSALQIPGLGAIKLRGSALRTPVLGAAKPGAINPGARFCALRGWALHTPGLGAANPGARRCKSRGSGL